MNQRESLRRVVLAREGLAMVSGLARYRFGQDAKGRGRDSEGCAVAEVTDGPARAAGRGGRGGPEGRPAGEGRKATEGRPAGEDERVPQRRGRGRAYRARSLSVPGFARWPETSSPKRLGKQARERVPRSAHARCASPAGRPSAVEAVEASNEGRLPALTPIRVGRMSATPFAFLRGSAGLMAADLAATPVSGFPAQICGDAHAANFGLYGDAKGTLVIDINDFDETATGPWEWDVKRLATSLVLAGRGAGAGEEVCRSAARDAVGAYRRTMRLLSTMPALDAWNAIADEKLVSHADARGLLGTLERVSAKARGNTSARFAARSTEVLADGSRRFTDAPPVLSRVSDREAEAVAGSLAGYLTTLSPDRLPLLARYAVHDVAFRVVGTGSVGTRSYVVLLLDHLGEPLVLQVKEARPSVLLPHLPQPGPEPVHEGRRVVLGQKRMQVVSDSLLGWTTVEGRPCQVRQFRNRKGSVDPAALAPGELDDYARMTGALLARAHSHSVDPRLVAGYCGKSDRFDAAVASFAAAYADRTEADHAELAAAVRSGRIAAERGV